MAQAELLQKLEGILRPVVEGLGYEVVDIRLQTDRGRRVLRLLVDRPGGITIDECAGLSREVSPHLEVHDPISGRYALEVSSPGIRRPLKRSDDFERFREERVAVRTRDPVDGRRSFRGRNLGMDAEGRVRIADEETKAVHAVPLAAVKEAHLDPEIKF